MNLKKGLRLGLLLATVALLLSGCFVKTVDELYALPTHSDAYYDLEAAIEQTMSDLEGRYNAPVAGVNRQSVQMADLDGDGEDEAVAFLKTGGQRPLQACIFDRVEGMFVNVALIQGSGTAFDSVEYAQMDDKAGLELILGRQLSNQVLKAVSVYSMAEGRVTEQMSANYSEYSLTDLDGNGKKDLFLLRFDAQQRTGVAELYRMEGGQMAREPEANLSAGIEAVKRIITGSMTQDVPAVFVASSYETDSIVTDVFAFRDGVFQNVSTSDTGFSAQTVRNYYVYADDIDQDGLIELPRPVALPTLDGSSEVYSILHWFNLGLNGEQTIKTTTYHNFAGGWYVTLPWEWQQDLRISRSQETAGVRGYVFSQWSASAGEAQPVFTIYAFSGEDRLQTAAADGRFLLTEKGDVAFSAQLGSSPWEKDLTQKSVEQMFHLIQIDWNTGER